MKTEPGILRIRWRRLVLDGDTCERCSGTEAELDSAAASLKKALSGLGIDVVLEKEALTEDEFLKDPLESNRIRMGGRPIEEILGAGTGSSPCCGPCGDVGCRTVVTRAGAFETVPAWMIVKAGLMAASDLIDGGPGEGGCVEGSCC